MKLGILKCDSVSAPFVAEHGQYPQMFANLLLPADPSLEFVVFDVERGEFPQTIDDVDAYLITGSRHGVNDGYPWISTLEDWVRNLNAGHKKVVGICFGHQLIAKALGGEVIKSPKGWGVGMSKNNVTRHKSWMKPLKDEFNILVSHQDQVVVLPKDAEILASSTFCPNYMMQIGPNLLSIQGHPEFTKSYSAALMVSREDTIGDAEFEKGMASLEAHEDDALIAQWIVQFLKSEF